METSTKRQRFFSIDKKKSTFCKKRNKTPDRDSKLFSNRDLIPNEDIRLQIIKGKQFHTPENYIDREVRDSIKSIKNYNQVITRFKYIGEETDEKSIIFENNYSFLETYFKFKNNKDFPEFFKFDLQVKVTNHILQDSLFQYVKYIIEGYIDKNEFFTERRYKEFLSFRKLLNQNFPGMFIPPIPPKKSFGNLEDGFIKLRKKFLQHFLNRLNQAPHLASSYATKIFLDSRDKNFLEIPLEIYYKTTQCIYEFYVDYFKFLEPMEIDSNKKNYVKDFYMKLNKTKDNLENFLYITAEAENIRINTEREVQLFYENLYDLDNNYIYDMLKLDKETRKIFNNDIIQCQMTENLYSKKFDNSNRLSFEWANLELIDSEAMIQAISHVFRYKEIFDKKVKILEKENNELDRLVNTSWIYSFFFASDLKYIQSKTEFIEMLKLEVETLKKLIELLYKILYYIEIPTFRKDKLKFYKILINKLITTENNSNEKMMMIYSYMGSHYKNIQDYSNKK